MSNNLRVSILLVSFLLYAVCLIIFKKGRMPLKYLLVWWIPATIVLIVAIFPPILEKVIITLGFQTISNMIIGLLFVVLIFICISLTIIISGQQTKITLLIQEVSLLKNRVDKEGNKYKDE